MIEQVDAAFPKEVAVDGVFVGSGVSATGNVDTLEDLASRIMTRDHALYEGARSYWLQNGSDLLQAKALAGHGHFEAWCKARLSYSKSKADKLMRTAEMVEPWLRSRNITDLPRPTLLYTLSAPSVPQVIRDEYAPRVFAKEKGVALKLKMAIERHRRNIERPERCMAKLPVSQAALEQHAATSAGCEAQDSDRRSIEQERQAIARSMALERFRFGLNRTIGVHTGLLSWFIARSR